MSATQSPTRSNKNHLGATMVLAGGIFLSFGGLLLRLFDEVEGWRILFYRSLAFIVTVVILIVIRHRGKTAQAFLDIGWSGIFAAFSLAGGFIFYVFAMLMTTVATVVFTNSSGPLFAAVFGWMLLGERVRLSTWVAIALAMAGIGLMFADGFSSGSYLGNIVALGVPLTFATMIIFMRRGKAFDMLPAICLAGIISATVSAVMAESLVISTHDLMLSILLGAVQVGGGFILITLGTRYVPSAEVALFAFSETLFAPIWVWLAIGEQPSPLALLGGAIVFTSVAGRVVSGVLAERRLYSNSRGDEGVA